MRFRYFREDASRGDGWVDCDLWGMILLLLCDQLLYTFKQYRPKLLAFNDSVGARINLNGIPLFLKIPVNEKHV